MLVFLTLVGAALLALVVVVVYLNDRVNELERRTAAGPAASGAAGGADDNTWRGLTGKRLWDAMAGKKGVTQLDEASLAALRLSYEDVLAKHIESLFRAGQADARKGAGVQPTAVKTLGSARGAVQSWIPLNHANALYRAGIDSTKSDIYEAERARMTLDETAQILYAQTGLSLSQPFSDLLLGNGGSLTGADPAAAAGAVENVLAGSSGVAASSAGASAASPSPAVTSGPTTGTASTAPSGGGLFSASLSNSGDGATSSSSRQSG